MGFIQHQARILSELRVFEKLPQQGAVCEVFDLCVCRGALLKADGIAHELAQLDVHFLGHTTGDRDGSLGQL